MTTLKIALRADQPKKDGTYPIIFRITTDRKLKVISSGLSVKLNQFREGECNWVIKHTDAILMNGSIERKRSEIAATIFRADINGVEFSMDSKKAGHSFFEALTAQQIIYEKRSMVSAYDKLKLRAKNLRAAWGKDVNIEAITKELVDDYINDRYSKNASPNTIKKDLSAFTGILTKSDHFSGKDYFKAAQSTLKKIPVNKEKLTMEEIKLLEDVKLFNLDAVARDMFLFSFYTHGMRFQSVATLKFNLIKEDKFLYRMNKNKKLLEIALHPKLKDIIDIYKDANTVYLFPVMKEEVLDPWLFDKAIDVASTLIRLRLKRVAVIAGIDKNLTMHIARHTFASLSLERGVSYEILKDALGHTDYATTQMYLNSISNNKVNASVNGLYD